MSLLEEAGTAARTWTDWRKVQTLRECTDELRNAFGVFSISCSREDMRHLVAAWSRVILILDSGKKDPDKKPLTSTP